MLTAVIPWKGDEKHMHTWNQMTIGNPCSNVFYLWWWNKGKMSFKSVASAVAALPELRLSTEWAFEDLVGWCTFPSWEQPGINQQWSSIADQWQLRPDQVLNSLRWRLELPSVGQHKLSVVWKEHVGPGEGPEILLPRPQICFLRCLGSTFFCWRTSQACSGLSLLFGWALSRAENILS